MVTIPLLIRHGCLSVSSFVRLYVRQIERQPSHLISVRLSVCSFVRLYVRQIERQPSHLISVCLSVCSFVRLYVRQIERWKVN